MDNYKDHSKVFLLPTRVAKHLQHKPAAAMTLIIIRENKALTFSGCKIKIPTTKEAQGMLNSANISTTQ
ncbi:hypothetical protein SLEP1_g8013 [Rubroshorea leprosula]|uniref:Uncharacterized protein n=1 Tax=Rubroshorea leprosula TaxID=152421 RepID=A0AAV5I888_9ROSI|nr:hypothetical protein SLEP1_g8013 [Rubroshorea leprosula]